MPPPFCFSLSFLLTLRVLQRRLPCTRRQRFYLPFTRARTVLRLPPESVALSVIVHLRCLQRTFWTFALGLVVSLGCGPGGIAAAPGPGALASSPSMYW